MEEIYPAVVRRNPALYLLKHTSAIPLNPIDKMKFAVHYSDFTYRILHVNTHSLTLIQPVVQLVQFSVDALTAFAQFCLVVLERNIQLI